jgi:hypothetical protein
MTIFIMKVKVVSNTSHHVKEIKTDNLGNDED